MTYAYQNMCSIEIIVPLYRHQRYRDYRKPLPNRYFGTIRFDKFDITDIDPALIFIVGLLHVQLVKHTFIQEYKT